MQQSPIHKNFGIGKICNIKVTKMYTKKKSNGVLLAWYTET